MLFSGYFRIVHLFSTVNHPIGVPPWPMDPMAMACLHRIQVFRCHGYWRIVEVLRLNSAGTMGTCWEILEAIGNKQWFEVDISRNLEHQLKKRT